MTVLNPPKTLEKGLTYSVKDLVRQEKSWKRKVQKTKKKAYVLEETEVQGLGKLRKLKTFQGFWRRVLEMLAREKAKHPEFDFEFVDCRKCLLGPPAIHRLGGFRFSQKELLVEALMAGSSGMIGAPTRYGKTWLIKNTLEAYPKAQTVVTLPGADLLGQMADDLRTLLPDREIKQIGGGSRVKYQSEDITVCSIDSLDKIDTGPVRLLVVDEPHAAMTGNRIERIERFELARRLAFGATLTGRFDGADFLMEGVFGPILSLRTFREAVTEGAICPIKVLMIPVVPEPSRGDRQAAMRKNLLNSKRISRLVRELSEKAIPKEWQTLFFIATEAQADMLFLELGGQRDGHVVAMAKKLSTKARKEITCRIRDNEIRRVVCSGIYAQGVTFHDVRVVVNCEGGGPYTKAIQKPGRLAEIRPGKTCGVLVDFKFEFPAGDYERFSSEPGNAALIRESNRRMAAYEKIGYDVAVVGVPEVVKILDEIQKKESKDGG